MLSNVPTVQPISRELKEQNKIKQDTVIKAPTSNMNNQEQVPEDAEPIHVPAACNSNGDASRPKPLNNGFKKTIFLANHVSNVKIVAKKPISVVPHSYNCLCEKRY